MGKYLRDALYSVQTVMLTDPRDWTLSSRDAWLYAILIGWNEALPEVAKKHRWADSDLARLQQMHTAVKRALAAPAEGPQ